MPNPVCYCQSILWEAGGLSWCIAAYFTDGRFDKARANPLQHVSYKVM